MRTVVINKSGTSNCLVRITFDKRHGRAVITRLLPASKNILNGGLGTLGGQYYERDDWDMSDGKLKGNPVATTVDPVRVEAPGYIGVSYDFMVPLASAAMLVAQPV